MYKEDDIYNITEYIFLKAQYIRKKKNGTI